MHELFKATRNLLAHWAIPCNGSKTNQKSLQSDTKKRKNRETGGLYKNKNGTIQLPSNMDKNRACRLVDIVKAFVNVQDTQRNSVQPANNWDVGVCSINRQWVAALKPSLAFYTPSNCCYPPPPHPILRKQGWGKKKRSGHWETFVHQNQ